MRLIFLITLCSCATPTIPYLRHFPVGDTRVNWFADGPGMALTVYNPTNQYVSVVVQCPDYGDVGEHYWKANITPHGEVRLLTQLMNRDQHANPCWIVNR